MTLEAVRKKIDDGRRKREASMKTIEKLKKKYIKKPYYGFVFDGKVGDQYRFRRGVSYQVPMKFSSANNCVQHSG